ncbi:MAG: AIPR family protein [Clostridia bacterium]|nr:AIPR family protein [Clostridia bacterium]MDD4386540.1 AIPR family protein [Clostridia bacterium]
MKKLTFKVKSFKKMESPYDLKTGRTKYVCFVNAKDIPMELENWMTTNPREQKLTTNVAKAIEGSLLDNKEKFHELNRGIVMSVDSVDYDNKENMMSIYMEDDIHGNIDGGHTLKIILNLQKSGSLLKEKYVFMEIFTQIESPVELAEARNTSVQVTQATIEELKQSFECIKEAIKNESFANRISYKQNELNGEKGIIEVREIIAITNMFNQTLYPITSQSINHPIQSYTGKESSLNAFLRLEKSDRDNIISNMSPIIPDIFELWDIIEEEFADKALKGKKIYRSKKYAKHVKNQIVSNTMFRMKTLDYYLPKGLIYPLVSAFRALVGIDSETGKYYWKVKPFEAWNDLGANLVKTLLTASEDLSDSPDTIGKSQNTWDILFKELYIYAFSRTQK